SRRRHTRFSRDWSSDVCSSDLSDGCGDWSDAGLVEQAGRGTLLDQGGHLVSDCRQLVVRSAYPLGQSDGLGPGDAGCEFFGATAPSSDRCDLAAVERAAGVYTEVDHAK